MKVLRQVALIAGIAVVAALPGMQGRAENLEATAAVVSASRSGGLTSGISASGTLALGIDPAVPGAAAGSEFVRGIQARPPDPCLMGEVVASPSRPYWDSGAATTACGNLETDFGWLMQPMGRGVRQRLLMSSVRYGLTPRLDLRWGVTNHIAQSGGETGPLSGIGDHSVSVTYRFHEQGRWSPAMAFSYGVNLPAANPSKGFGSGYIDHQFLLIASRDVGATHVDLNAVGTLTRDQNGHDGAVQFGLAVTQPLTRKLAWILESYGGPQPGTADRFGAALSGGSYMMRPWLVVDGAYARTYTAGSPRQQILFGITSARRLGFGRIGGRSRVGRWLGR